MNISRYLLLLLLPCMAVAEDTLPESAPEPYAIDAIRRFSDTFEHIRQYYVEEVSDDELLNLAIHGMIEGLDPHSTYLEPAEYTELQENTSGEFSGLGLEIEMDGGLVRIVSPIDDTPAAKAGIRAGDLIIKLDNTQVRGLSLSQAIELMRGEKDTDIRLTILRNSAKGPFDVVLTRDTIKAASVRSEWLDKGFAYVRIASFQQDTGTELLEQLQTLKKETLKGLVLDLRNNPGGVVNAAVDVSDAFLETGTIVYTEGRNTADKTLYEATQGDELNGAALVVLVNEGSASAAEIVAGALQDNKRAIIAGTRSFGKGSVQRVLPLAEDYAIKLTTSLYFTPNGRSIQAQGIIPDIDVPRAEVKTIQSEFDFSERSLATHLDTKTKDEASVSNLNTKRLKNDNQLVSALRILKSASLLK